MLSSVISVWGNKHCMWAIPEEKTFAPTVILALGLRSPGLMLRPWVYDMRVLMDEVWEETIWFNIKRASFYVKFYSQQTAAVDHRSCVVKLRGRTSRCDWWDLAHSCHSRYVNALCQRWTSLSGLLCLTFYIKRSPIVYGTWHMAHCASMSIRGWVDWHTKR